MDVVKHEILAVFPNSVNVRAHRHTHTDQNERAALIHAAAQEKATVIGLSQRVYWLS